MGKQFSICCSILGIFILVVLISSCTPSLESTMSQNRIELEDAMYLVERVGSKKSEILPLQKNEKIISFNNEFIEKTGRINEYLVINVNEFAPIKLAEKPKTEAHDSKGKRLTMKLSEEAKDQLKNFTANNLNAHAAIVVKNEALSVHKIKAVIDGGFMQISWCSNNACEALLVELEDNIIE